MFRTNWIVAGAVRSGVGLATLAGCSSEVASERSGLGDDASCATGADCTGTSSANEGCLAGCDGGADGVARATDELGAANGDASTTRPADGGQTDVGCGGPTAPKCPEGKSCLQDSDCEVACSYSKKCVGAPSCAAHLGGDTCGTGEVGEVGALHESCCRTLEVPGYVDPRRQGKTVFLDKYEVTAGRVRAFIESIAKHNGGIPDVRAWVLAHRPSIWNDAWTEFMPTSYEGDTKIIQRRLLGDPRPEDNGQAGPPGPGVILPPATDEPRNMGVNYVFNSEIYVDLHGNNCGAFRGSYGFSTYYYDAAIVTRDGQLARADGVTKDGQPIAAKDLLDVKAMNCIPNALLAAFCAWDGGQLATDEVLDFVTDTPASLANISGCGAQYDNHGELLGNKLDHTVQTGGRCADVALVNATFDAGDALPVKGSALNAHNYHYPDLGPVTHDKAWQIAAPGRASRAIDANGQAVDAVRISAGAEPWMDLNGNLSEAALDVSGASFTGAFALKYRGIGYGSSRSDLNMKPIKDESVLRVQRPEAKAAYTGGRCMRFR